MFSWFDSKLKDCYSNQTTCPEGTEIVWRRLRDVPLDKLVMSFMFQLGRSWVFLHPSCLLLTKETVLPYWHSALGYKNRLWEPLDRMTSLQYSSSVCFFFDYENMDTKLVPHPVSPEGVSLFSQLCTPRAAAKASHWQQGPWVRCSSMLSLSSALLMCI